MIIDAGSSGSRVYVYKWVEYENGPSVQKVEQLASVEGKDLNVNSVPKQTSSSLEANLGYKVAYHGTRHSDDSYGARRDDGNPAGAGSADGAFPCVAGICPAAHDPPGKCLMKTGASHS